MGEGMVGDGGGGGDWRGQKGCCGDQCLGSGLAGKSVRGLLAGSARWALACRDVRYWRSFSEKWTTVQVRSAARDAEPRQSSAGQGRRLGRLEGGRQKGGKERLPPIGNFQTQKWHDVCLVASTALPSISKVKVHAPPHPPKRLPFYKVNVCGCDPAPSKVHSQAKSIARNEFLQSDLAGTPA